MEKKENKESKPVDDIAALLAATMTMEQGAIINGSLSMKPAAKAEPAKPEQNKK